MGSIPIIIASAVISTGRNRVNPAFNAASPGSSPSSSRSFEKLITRMLFDVATPMHMIAPVSAGTLTVVPVTNSIQTIPASAAGRAIKMMKGIEPRLKVHHDQQVDEKNRKRQSGQQSDERRPHGENLTALDDLRTLRQIFPGLIDDLGYVARDAAKIASIHRSENIDYRLNVVMGDDRHLRSSRETAQACKNLWRRRAIRDRNILEILQRIDAILRRLRRDVVAHAGSRIEPECRRRLGAAAQRNQQVVRHVLLREAYLTCFRPVYFDVKFRVVERLLNPQIHRAGNKFQLVDQILRESAVRRQIAAYDLNVERRRQPEIRESG